MTPEEFGPLRFGCCVRKIPFIQVPGLNADAMDILRGSTRNRGSGSSVRLAYCRSASWAKPVWDVASWVGALVSKAVANSQPDFRPNNLPLTPKAR